MKHLFIDSVRTTHSSIHFLPIHRPAVFHALPSISIAPFPFLGRHHLLSAGGIP